MKSIFLFNNKFKSPGLLLLLAGITLGIISMFINELSFFDLKVFALWSKSFKLIGGGDNLFFSIIENNILNEIIATLIILGGTLYGFSKEKTEDEYINKLRLDSLLTATYMNYGFLLFAVIFIYDLAFFHILVYNMFTLLTIFIIKFRYSLYKFQKASE